MTVCICEGNRYCESISWNQTIFFSRFSGITTPIHSTSQSSIDSISSGMMFGVMLMKIGIHYRSDPIGLREEFLYSQVPYIFYGVCGVLGVFDLDLVLYS